MRERVLTPEILDGLAHDDPDAIRSRRDLRLINGVAGNFRWAERTLDRLGATKIVELGAGDALFAKWFAERHPEVGYTAIDLDPRPRSLPERVEWLQGDLFEKLPGVQGDAIFANLFLHHLDNGQLARLGQQLLEYRFVVCSEPTFSRLSHVAGLLYWVGAINGVTNHDMHVSIDAGFRGLELPEMLGLDSSRWKFEIRHTSFGMFRMIAENLK